MSIIKFIENQAHEINCHEEIAFQRKLFQNMLKIIQFVGHVEYSETVTTCTVV